MRNLLLLATAAVAVAAMPTAASAAVYLPGDPEFTTSGDTTPPIEGVVSATIGRTGITAGAFEDIYRFIVDVDGIGSGGILTTLSGTDTNIDFTSVTINGAPIAIIGQFSPIEIAATTGINIFAGDVNELIIRGVSFGANGSYGGNITFTPSAVPEPATWGMMLAGFGALGFAMRRRQQVRINFA